MRIAAETTQGLAAPDAFDLRGDGADSALFRKTFGCFATGVAVATCAPPDGAPQGLTINSIASVSLDPPLALFCVETKAATLKAFLRAGHFALNLLPEGADALSTRFARDHALNEADRVDVWKSGAPILREALAVADCRLSDAHAGGDHFILVGRVLEVGAQSGGRPLVYYQGGYRKLSSDDSSSETGSS